MDLRLICCALETCRELSCPSGKPHHLTASTPKAYMYLAMRIFLSSRGTEKPPRSYPQ